LTIQVQASARREARAKRLSELPVATPHLEYDGQVALEALEAMRLGLARSGVESRIHLALKSCYCRPLLEALAGAGVGAEVMSELEYDYARSCGFPAPATIVNGMGRGLSGLQRPLAEGATVIVDSDGDFRALQQLVAGRPERRVRVGLRLKLRCGSPGGTAYSSSTSKLGLDRDGPLLEALVAWAMATPQVSLDLVHAHVATNERSAAVHNLAVDELGEAVSSLEAAWPGLRFDRVNLGGGFGTFLEDERDLAAAMFEQLGDCFRARFPDRVLVVEPGRYLTNRSGSMVGTVLEVKEGGRRKIVVSDIRTNVLIPISTARYTLDRPLSPLGEVPLMLVDGITSPDNVIVQEATVGTVPSPGDRIVVGSCGAYSHVFTHIWAYDVPTVSYLAPSGSRMELVTDDDVDARRRRELAL
jgi:diaminopimelate decarboxylase